MPEDCSFNISSFYAFLDKKQLMACKCNACSSLILPPKPMCTKCLSTNLKWVELKGTGKLLSYTVIHVAPEQFQSMTPYIVGIVELDEGIRLPGMIFDAASDELKVGMRLKVDFSASETEKWPAWGRYYFRPV
jgi:uncharacterized OB-fold protein